jgi:hypothetical protein
MSDTRVETYVETYATLYNLCEAGDILDFRFTQEGRRLSILTPVFDATPENLPHHLPPTHPDRERSRRIDTALYSEGYRCVGPKWEYDVHSAVLWQHFIYSP